MKTKNMFLVLFLRRKWYGIRSTNMPTYPSSLYKGTARSANGTTNDPGSYLWNNLTTYQELKDTTIGYGTGPNDSETATLTLLQNILQT